MNKISRERQAKSLTTNDLMVLQHLNQPPEGHQDDVRDGFSYEFNFINCLRIFSSSDFFAVMSFMFAKYIMRLSL